MKNHRVNLIIIVALLFILQACSIRLVDFTVISSKNVNLPIDRSQGQRVEGSKSYFLGIGWNIKDALDEAIQSAGPGADMLIDGVVRYSSYPFISVVKVEGVAINSSKMEAMLGEKGFKKWLGSKNVFDPENVDLVKK